MPRPKRWADLAPGLAILTLVGVAVAAVLTLARPGTLRGRTTRLYAVMSSARGVTAGTEVWLAGYQVGTVADVVFRPPALDTAARVLLVLDLLERHREAVRRDADVQLRAGGSVIGATVVSIGAGSPSRPPVRPGDTLVARGPTYVERARADLAAAGAQVPAVVANLRILGAQLRSARGTLGALGATNATVAVSAAALNGTRLVERTLHGPGTIGLALGGGRLAGLAGATMAAVDSVRSLVTSPAASLGRFRRDSTLLETMTALRADVARLADGAASPDGTAGRARADGALREQLAHTQTELDALIADFKRNPLRYVAF